MEELARHWASAQVNMPKETSVAKVRPMGSMESGLLGKPYAMTYPNNTISINQDKVEEDDSIRDTLVHELTHVGQKPRGLTQFLKDSITPWNKRPIEIEAINKEALYPWKEKGRDTWLPPEKKKKKSS
jgi:hypothetical protein